MTEYICIKGDDEVRCNFDEAVELLKEGYAIYKETDAPETT